MHANIPKQSPPKQRGRLTKLTNYEANIHTFRSFINLDYRLLFIVPPPLAPSARPVDPDGDKFVVTACFCRFIVMRYICTYNLLYATTMPRPGPGTCFANRNLIYCFTLLTSGDIICVYFTIINKQNLLNRAVSWWLNTDHVAVRCFGHWTSFALLLMFCFKYRSLQRASIPATIHHGDG